jgi:prepilin-type N-terminal cleavage/methylation domain-containing protein
MNTTSISHRARPGFTLMEVLVAIAIIVVLAAISYPIMVSVRSSANKNEAMQRMKTLGGAVANYASQNNGDLPAEDAEGKDDWETSKKPGAEKAWYNALPKLLGKKGVGDFAREGNMAAFYERDSCLFLPGAHYPENRRFAKPYFAIAINTKLHRKDKSGKGDPDAKKPDVKLNEILQPSRTVLFVEQGLPGEPKAHDTISRNDYNGSCKGSAKSFVARYRGKGIIAFVDGTTAEVSGKDLLTPSGGIIWDATEAAAGTLRYLWTPDPKEDPNSR